MAGERFPLLVCLLTLSFAGPLGRAAAFDLDEEQVNFCQFCELLSARPPVSSVSNARIDDLDGGLLAASVLHSDPVALPPVAKPPDAASPETVSSSDIPDSVDMVFSKTAKPGFPSCTRRHCHKIGLPNHSVKHYWTRRKGSAALSHTESAVSSQSLEEAQREVPPPFHWLFPPYPTSKLANSASVPFKPSSSLSPESVSGSSFGSSPFLSTDFSSLSSVAPLLSPSGYHAQLGAPSIILPSSWDLPNPFSSSFPSPGATEPSEVPAGNTTELRLFAGTQLGDLDVLFNIEPREISLLLQSKEDTTASESVSQSLRPVSSSNPLSDVSLSRVPLHTQTGPAAAPVLPHQEISAVPKSMENARTVPPTKPSLVTGHHSSLFHADFQRTNRAKDREKRLASHVEAVATSDASASGPSTTQNLSPRLSSKELCVACEQEHHVPAADSTAFSAESRPPENSDDPSNAPLLSDGNVPSPGQPDTGYVHLPKTSNQSEHPLTFSNLSDRLSQWIAAESGFVAFHRLADPPEARQVAAGATNEQQTGKRTRADIFSSLVSEEDILRAAVGIYYTLYLQHHLGNGETNSIHQGESLSLHSPQNLRERDQDYKTVDEGRTFSSSQISTANRNHGETSENPSHSVSDASAPYLRLAAHALGVPYSDVAVSSHPSSQKTPRVSSHESRDNEPLSQWSVRSDAWTATQKTDRNTEAGKWRRPLSSQHMQAFPDTWLLSFLFLRWLDMWRRQVMLQEAPSSDAAISDKEIPAANKRGRTVAHVAEHTVEGQEGETRTENDDQGVKQGFLGKRPATEGTK
ncbi:conserved hypothetical protein [Neospora caninum Liverpool]|uniref:Uncharacterized protein n=1 Tax=Neospora caninum (strain Liverpool) TaxID=572307 RepID=F0VIX6_NEOCL|nr:conserved hypothetical protein [Neospora caninum Liverpool]CBZ53687.1 conserved hypothetical protein [Neospora caninum Liverpool]CEL67678.1 TPA: hypothetical protein BN1204_034690 [Neospora caninum Liverpool]|eukprot:XP_003883719.1 conserved hypothetical protein [Neospora caninum Liverpool]